MARSNLRRLIDYVRPERTRYRRATAYSITNKIFDIAPELLIGVAVDVVVHRQDSFLGQIGVVSPGLQLGLLAILTALIWGGESWFQYLYQVAWRRLAQVVQARVRGEVYDHVQRLPMAELGGRRTGELQTLLTEDVNQLERFLNGGVNDIIQVVTSTLAVMLVFFVLAPQVAVFAVLPIPIIALTALAFQRGLAQRYSGVREAGGRLGARLTAQLGGILTLRAFTAEAQALAALEADSQRYVEANDQAIRLSSAFIPLVRMAVLAGFLVTLVLGGLRTLDGELGVGAFSVLVFLTQRLLWPFTQLGETVDLYQRSMASAGRLFDLLALDTEPRTAPSETTPSSSKAADASGEASDPDGAPVSRGIGLRFRQVGFRYPGALRDALSEVDFEVAPESFVGLVGATGSGKSTVVKLLLRLYEPTQGQIWLGDRRLDRISPWEARRAIGWVGQDAFVFYGTIRENIALGRPDATDEQILAAAAAAELLPLIEALPLGLDTPVGEFGTSLSGGERQRLTIARALVKDPSVLIFDEATSAVDNETEAAIHRSVRRAARGRTVLAIAHRLTTVREAELLLVMADGCIVERGTHPELLARGGIYADLVAAGRYE